MFVRATTTVQSWAKGQEAQACWEWSLGPILEGRVNKSAGLQAMGEDMRQGSSQAGRKDWTPSTYLPSSDVHGDQLQSYGPQGWFRYRILQGHAVWVGGGHKGWDKWVDGDKTGISSVRGYH